MSYDALFQSATRYYGVDWAVSLCVFVSLFLLGEKRSSGFLFGMISSLLGVLFSIQISSIANGLTSMIVFGLYLRGYAQWNTKAATPAVALA